MKNQEEIFAISSLLKEIDNPARLRILLAIGEGESCVCHLESLLQIRQATISQHLMALRKAGVLTTRRDGKYIYYRLNNPSIVELLKIAAQTAGYSADFIAQNMNLDAVAGCDCPKCSS